MQEKEKKPRIRFKGFTEAWEQRKLLEVANYRNGKAHENDIDENGKYIVVNSKFVSTEGEIKKYSNKQNEPLEQNDIAFVLSDVPNGRAIAKTFLVDKSNKYTLNQRIAGITPHDNINTKYLAITMNRNKYFLQFDDGVKQTNLSLEDMKKYENFYPEKKEQDKLGNTFETIDNLITLHQRKYDKLVNVKKALLEKMFPKNGSNVPEIRFKGFTEAWEQRKFGNYGSVSMCKRVFKNETSDNGDIPFYKIGTFGEQADAFISNEKYEYYKSKFSYPNKGDILLSASGTIGRIVEYTGEKAYFQDSNIVWLNHNDNIKNSFLKVLYPTVKWDGIEGSTIKRLYNSNFLNTDINVPKIIEQEKIGLFFNNIDNLITLHQRKLDKLKNIKKSLLEKMFV